VSNKVSNAILYLKPSVDLYIKFYRDRPRGTPPSGAKNAKGIAEYSDFGPVEGHISETVKDRR